MLSELFDQYRRFYQQASDLSAARVLAERLKNDDSVIFMAKDKALVIGFIQLYLTFSSVAMKTIWILNDLYVDEAYRRKGVEPTLAVIRYLKTLLTIPSAMSIKCASLNRKPVMHLM